MTQLKFIAAILMLIPSYAIAQTPTPENGKTVRGENSTSLPSNDGTLPTPVSSHEAPPEVATPGTPAGGIIRQAGIGGVVGYGRAGVLELGGSAGFLVAKNISSVQIAPSVGWFIADNFQLSGILNFNYASAEGNGVTTTSLLGEASYHLPFNRTIFGFLGIGLGPAYIEDSGVGFAVAPRLGMNVLVGRSGILSPSISFQYTTQDAMDTASGTLIAVNSSLRANLGYTVMW